MFPNPQTIAVTKSATLREFLEGLGSDILYAYDHRVITVLINGQLRWPSARLRRGDIVTFFPIVTGG